MSNTTATYRRLRPMYGHGMANVKNRVHPTGDLFCPVSDEDREMQFRQRSVAIQDYLNGKRARPEVLDTELVSDTNLSGDEFDMQFEAGARFRCYA